jgi:hypothetical protein
MTYAAVNFRAALRLPCRVKFHAVDVLDRYGTVIYHQGTICARELVLTRVNTISGVACWLFGNRLGVTSYKCPLIRNSAEGA